MAVVKIAAPGEYHQNPNPNPTLNVIGLRNSPGVA